MRLQPLLLISLLACGRANDQEAQPDPLSMVYQASQVRGQVRVTLLEIGRVTAFQPSGNLPASSIPGLRIVYLVECIGPDSIRNWVTKEPTYPLFAKGKKLQPRLPTGMPPGSNTQAIPFNEYQADRSTLPAPENPDRAAVYVSFYRGNIAPEGAVELHLTAGFNDRSDEFIFQNLHI